MQITFLDAATLGDDLTYEMFEKFGNVTVHQSTASREFADHIQDADVVIIN